MVGGNYPPGTSRRDLIRGGIIEPHRHECEFLMDDDRANPIIEDGAAIFHTECRYVEGEYGQGYSCDETRSYRFEYSTLETSEGEEIELHPITEWEKNDDDIAEKVASIEEAYHNFSDERTEIDVDPDPEAGVVAIEYNGYTLRYEP